MGTRAAARYYEPIDAREMKVQVSFGTRLIFFTGPCGQRWKISFEDWGYLQAAVEDKVGDAFAAYKENLQEYSSRALDLLALRLQTPLLVHTTQRPCPACDRLAERSMETEGK